MPPRRVRGASVRRTPEPTMQTSSSVPLPPTSVRDAVPVVVYVRPGRDGSNPRPPAADDTDGPAHRPPLHAVRLGHPVDDDREHEDRDPGDHPATDLRAREARDR